VPRLSGAALTDLPLSVPVPTYPREAVDIGILHMSVGGFHRGHQAGYMDELFRDHGLRDWGICGAGLRPGDSAMRDALVPQDCLYTVVERSGTEDRARVMGALLRYIYAPADPAVLIEQMAQPEIRIVTLTITEKGYCVHQVTGEFDPDHPDIVHDLAHPDEPVSGIGYLVAGLDLRRQRGLGPFTVLSCDNLQGNGDVARRMVLAFAERRDPALRDWIAECCTFPNCMVDRITPVTTDDDRRIVRERYGYDDAWPVVCEPFRQWVVEDRFCNGRPDWEQAGVQMTGDVYPYEKMKIRLLNSSHSAIAYLGYLAGYRYIHEAAADEEFQRFMMKIMDEEVTSLLDPVPGVDLESYKRTLVERFANPTIKDTVARVAMDGSQKIPKFMLPSVREQLERGGPVRLQCLAIAGWFRYLRGKDENGEAIVIDDPAAEKLQRLAVSGGEDAGPLLAMQEIFGEDLAGSEIFTGEVRRALQSLYRKSARATLREYLGSVP